MTLRRLEIILARVPPPVWGIFSLIGIIGIWWMGMRELTGMPLTASFIKGKDKILHALIYGFLAAFLYRAFYPPEPLKPPRHPNAGLLIILIVAFTGIMDEIFQGFTPGRSRDLWDLAADILGATAVLAWGITLRRRESRRRAPSKINRSI